MSMIADMVTGGDKPKVEPLPTRDTAADAVDAAEKERKRRAGLGYGGSPAMLSGPSGVGAELTGTRSAGGG
jgi:hypothetical protein